ncbi:MAG: response regulator [Bacteroidetes bacterium]|nr:response regulator [Bacteroidota bacterium]
MILIVDDNPDNLFTLKTLLDINGFEVDTAVSGEEALKAILKKEYNLIMLDVQMPLMDGYEVAEAISGLNKTKDIPIIFLSAVNTEKRFISKGYASGAVDYIAKPFDPDLLIQKVKNLHRLSLQTSELKKSRQSLEEEIAIRKKTEELLSKSHEQLEQKVRERTSELAALNQALIANNNELQQYAYLASHDLQEPLRKIITFASMMEERFNANGEFNMHYLQKVMSSANRMRDLIQDLLLYSQISDESGFVSVDLNIALEEALSDLEVVVENKHAEIKADKLPVIESIPGQLRQVFMNLLSNSLKYSKNESRPVIEISVDYTNEKKFDSPVVQDGRYCRIKVKDNGIGIDERYTDKMFVIFQRLHGKSQYEGTGIGLAIVRKIIERHQGLIKANGKEGEGTTISILIPKNISNK